MRKGRRTGRRAGTVGQNILNEYRRHGLFDLAQCTLGTRTTEADLVDRAGFSKKVLDRMVELGALSYRLEDEPGLTTVSVAKPSNDSGLPLKASVFAALNRKYKQLGVQWEAQEMSRRADGSPRLTFVCKPHTLTAFGVPATLLEALVLPKSAIQMTLRGPKRRKVHAPKSRDHTLDWR